MDKHILTVKNLRKTYSPGTEAAVEGLKGINLQMAQGEFLAMMGPSGCGKSTLLNILGTLDRSTSGTVEIAGTEIESLKDRALAQFRNRTIGFVFQFHHLLVEFTVLENVLMPIKLCKGSASSQDVSYVTALLERVGLGDVLHKRANRISGGQQQRVAIVRAMANQPSLVLADEPTGNLDSKLGEDVFRLMREMTSEQGIAFLMVTHNEALAERADRILHIKDGQIDRTSERSALVAEVLVRKGA